MRDINTGEFDSPPEYLRTPHVQVEVYTSLQEVSTNQATGPDVFFSLFLFAKPNDTASTKKRRRHLLVRSAVFTRMLSSHNE
eukprot:156256-Prorocentrum_minimum.AAC.1